MLNFVVRIISKCSELNCAPHEDMPISLNL